MMEKSENVLVPPPSTGPYPQSQNPPYMPQAYSQPYPQAYPQQQQQQQQPHQQPTVQLQSTANVVTIQTMSVPDNERNAHYNSKGSKRTGYLQIGIGILCIILGVVAVVVGCSLANGGTTIWSGLLFFLGTGLLGVRAGKTKGTCAIVGYMVMCIISAIMAFNAFTVVLVAACSEQRMQCHWEYTPDLLISDYDVNYEHKYVCRNRAGIGGCIAVNSILVVLCLTEMIVCIIASALCCRGVCCRPSPARNQSVVYQPQQMIIAAPGQPLPQGNVVIQQYTVAAPQPSAPPPQYGESVPSTGQIYAVPQDRPPAYTPVYNQVVEQSTPGAAV